MNTTLYLESLLKSFSNSPLPTLFVNDRVQLVWYNSTAADHPLLLDHWIYENQLCTECICTEIEGDLSEVSRNLLDKILPDQRLPLSCEVNLEDIQGSVCTIVRLKSDPKPPVAVDTIEIEPHLKSFMEGGERPGCIA